MVRIQLPYDFILKTFQELLKLLLFLLGETAKQLFRVPAVHSI
jgi:hypothetical protein